MLRLFSTSACKFQTKTAKNLLLEKNIAIPEKTITGGPRVKFNLQKIRRLSGLEKKMLLKDYINTGAINESCFVFNTIIENGTGNHLPQNVLFNLFNLLKVDPMKHKEHILLINQISK